MYIIKYRDIYLVIVDHMVHYLDHNDHDDIDYPNNHHHSFQVDDLKTKGEKIRLDYEQRAYNHQNVDIHPRNPA